MANMIEPCCAERQLGSILREGGGRAVMFQTQGDVTLEAMMKATMLMAGDRPRVLTIAAQTLPVNAMRTVVRYAQLGYISKLRLMVAGDGWTVPAAAAKGEADSTEGLSPIGALDALRTAVPELELEVAVVAKVPQLLVWQGSTGVVAIQGELPDAVEPGLHLYAGIVGGVQNLNIHAVVSPFDALFRVRRVEMVVAKPQPAEQPTTDATDGGSAVSDLVADNAPTDTETKKSRKTKKNEGQ